MADAAPRVVVLNAQRLDFDKTLDWASTLESVSMAVDYHATTTTPEECLARVTSDHAVVVTKEFPLAQPTIARLPASVRLIVEAGTGYNNIDLAAAAARNITVCNVPSYSTEAVATLVLTHVLNFSASIVLQQRRLFARDVASWAHLGNTPHYELEGRVIGLVGGRGAIGSRVAQLAKAFRMRVHVSSRTADAMEHADAVYTSLDDMLPTCDFLSIHLPLNPSTRNLLNATRIAKLKPNAVVINTARGPIVDEAALCDALASKRIAGAGLDVFEVEPPPPSSPLYTLENVVLTNHVGWQRRETRQRLVAAVAANVAAFLAGAPTNVVS